MSDDAVPGRQERGRAGEQQAGGSTPAGHSERGLIGQALAAAARFYPLPPGSVPALLAAGVLLGVAGDVLLRGPGPVGLNLSLWVALVAAAALALHGLAGLVWDRGRIAWLVTGALLAAGLAWRDAPPLRLLALGCATLAFALAAHRRSASWVRHAGVLGYAGALALGALQAWTAAALALGDAARTRTRIAAGRPAGWRRAAAVARGLLIAAPLVAVFGALFMSADAVFAKMVGSVFRFDFQRLASHILVFSILAWISTGYLRGFLTGTQLPPLGGPGRSGAPSAFAPKRPPLGITETATALAALDLLFLLFVIVQFRYLFGGDALIQVTPDLTYAEYARRGFFELVLAVALVVPVLLGADWLADRRGPRDVLVFRMLAGLQIGLVLAIAASALQRLRLYRASYGLTESRFYAMALLIWIAAMLLWLAATVLRGRRDAFAFGTLVSGLLAVALLFVVNPDAIIARANLARLVSTDAAARFDARYAASLSADAAPVLMDALPALPPGVQCTLARSLLRRWPPDRERTVRGWNWSAARVSGAVREHEARLRSMAGPGQGCGTSGGK
ncbi:MAG: DUF4173 domain-containing protein [Bryobacterales bacterium]|nr:DUF4173 domain-containing protein [Bryobacterales bacterium]